MVCKISLDIVATEGSAGSRWNLRLVGSIWFGGSRSYNNSIFNISRSIFLVLVFRLFYQYSIEIGHNITILKLTKFINVDHLKLNQHYQKVCKFETLRQMNKSTTFPQRNFELEFPDILSQSLIRCHISSTPGIPK